MTNEEKPTYFAVKAMFPAESVEIAERIEWCKENEMDFIPVNIRGIKVGEIFYEEDEMKDIGILELQDDAGVTKGEIDLSTMPPINIGMGFAFKSEEDVTAFKLRWVA